MSLAVKESVLREVVGSLLAGDLLGVVVGPSQVDRTAVFDGLNRLDRLPDLLLRLADRAKLGHASLERRRQSVHGLRHLKQSQLELFRHTAVTSSARTLKEQTHIALRHGGLSNRRLNY